jgi:hypothetical protein
MSPKAKKLAMVGVAAVGAVVLLRKMPAGKPQHAVHRRI